MKQNSKAIAANILKKILQHEGSLATHITTDTPPQTKYYCYQVCRNFFLLAHLCKQLLPKQPRQKDNDIYALLMIGLQALIDSEDPDYAIVSETVNACHTLQKTWAKALVNKVLRQFINHKETYLANAQKNIEAKFNHPAWYIDAVKTLYPQQWQQILSSNNQKPPLTLRINNQKITTKKYLEQYGINAQPIADLTSAIILNNPCSAEKIPGFAEGQCSIQDGSAQCAATLLFPQDAETILDACAAPGGKTCHLLEMCPTLKITAIDLTTQRTEKIDNNLQRLGFNAKVLNANANEVDSWWDKKVFDKILLDAPCSATGIIRRQPDIKLLKQQTDIDNLRQQQQNLLNNLWPLLKPGGTLLYVTCSILKKENDEVIKQFVNQHSQAKVQSISLPFGNKTDYGWQILPGDKHCDGLYYSSLKKLPVSSSP